MQNISHFSLHTYSHKMNHFCSITPFSNDTDHNNNSQPRHTGENRSGIALATNIFFVFSLYRTSLKLSPSFSFFSLFHSLTVSFSLCRSLFLFLFLSCSYTHELIQYCAVLYCTDKIGWQLLNYFNSQTTLQNNHADRTANVGGEGLRPPPNPHDIQLASFQPFASRVVICAAY